MDWESVAAQLGLTEAQLFNVIQISKVNPEAAFEELARLNVSMESLASLATLAKKDPGFMAKYGKKYATILDGEFEV